MVILISNKIDFNAESITTEEKEVLHNDRRSFDQQFEICMDKIRSKYIKQTLAELQGEINKSTTIQDLTYLSTNQTDANH